MSEESFPGTARRFESVGFSEIVRVRNRVMELLAAGPEGLALRGRRAVDADARAR